MPLFDALGREIPLKPIRRVKRHKPKNVGSTRRKPLQITGAQDKIRQNAEVEVTLLAKHHLAGTDYGPGIIRVPKHVASTLLEGERRAQASDENFTGTRACMIGPGVQKGSLSVRRVASEYFDNVLASGVPFGVVDRSTAQFTAY